MTKNTLREQILTMLDNYEGKKKTDLADAIAARILASTKEARDDTWKEAYDQGYRDAKNGN